GRKDGAQLPRSPSSCVRSFGLQGAPSCNEKGKRTREKVRMEHPRTMALPTGTRLGPYEITGSLGAGGMGEVYRARDTRLDRTVAIEVLRERLATDSTFR